MSSLANIILHPEYLALVADANQKPDDDLPRLVIADWLEEHGQEYYASYIRESIWTPKTEIERMRRDDMHGICHKFIVREWFVKRQILNSVFEVIDGSYTLERGFIKTATLNGVDFARWVRLPDGTPKRMYTLLRKTQPGYVVDVKTLLRTDQFPIHWELPATHIGWNFSAGNSITNYQQLVSRMDDWYKS